MECKIEIKWPYIEKTAEELMEYQYDIVGKVQSEMFQAAEDTRKREILQMLGEEDVEDI